MSDLAHAVEERATSAYLEMLRGKSVAVIGGTGLLGSNLLHLLATYRRVTADEKMKLLSVSRSMPQPNDRFADVSYKTGSVLDQTFVRALPEVDYAIYAAGTTSNYVDQAVETARLASEGFSAVLAHAARAESCLLISSARVYGPRLSADPVLETDVCTLRSPDLRNVYDGAKLIAEAVALRAAQNGQRVVIARLGNVHGRYHGREPAIPLTKMVDEAIARRCITLTGPPASTRNHVFVLDAAEGLLRALLRGRSGEAYNIGGRDHLTNADFATRVAASMPWPIAVEHANPDATPDHMCLSIDKAERELSYAPTCSVTQSIPLTVEWTLAQRENGRRDIR